MPDTRQAQTNAVSNSSDAASQDKLEGAMWQLKIEDGQEGGDGQANPYPARPGEPDCIFYLRTGVCGYGSNCRYNHPTYTGQGILYRGDLPEREGQPDCQFFLKTGTCKFGTTCKYHHPRDKLNARPVQLNILGLPMRKDEKSCPYYMRTGSCKFGIACKFNHPQPATLGTMLPTGSSSYGSTASSVVPQSGLPLVSGLSAYSLSRAPFIASPRMQGLPAYMPLVLPPAQGTLPVQQGWSTYMVSNSKQQAQSGSSTLVNFPERPDQPECQYYMKTGSCKYGASCKYHHPKERNQVATSTIGPHGLPLRPGQPVCTFYSMYGRCKYDSACKFDHPFVGYYNYMLPAFSIPDPSALYSNLRSSQSLLTSETPMYKTLKLSDRPVKIETSNDLHEPEKNENGNPSSQTSSRTAPRSESPQNDSE